MTDPRRFGLGVSAGELPGDLRPIRPREPRPERDPLHPPRPPAGVEFRRPLGATAAISLNLQAVHGRSLRSMPPSTPPDGSAAAEAVPIIPSDLPGTSPRAGTVTAYRRPRGPSLEEVTLGAEGPLGAPTYRGIEDVQEPNHQEAGHPGTFPNRPERNAAGPTSSPNRTAEGRDQEPNQQEAGHPGTFPNQQERNATGLGGTRNRAAEGRAQEPNRQEAGHPGTFPNRQERNATGLGGTRNRPAEGRGAWRPGVLQPEERGPASLLRADRYPCLLPLASAGPARWHRPGRLARSRAATRGLGLRGLAARVFGPPAEPPSEALASECGHFVGSRLELHDGDEPNCPLRVEDRVDAFNNLKDLGEVAFDVRSRGVGLDYQTGFLEQLVRALDLAPHGDTGADRDRLDFGCSFHGP